MTFPPIDEQRLFQTLNERENPIDPRLGRIKALRSIGRTFELEIFIDAEPPKTFLFTKAPTLLDVAACLGDIPLDDHIVSLRMSTHTFASTVPDFANPARTPKIAQRVGPLILTEEQKVNGEANDAA